MPRHAMPVDTGFLDPWERLIRVRIEGRDYQVPENNTVLRVLQYLEVDLDPCRLCWNGECDNCFVQVADAATGGEVPARGCETVAWDGMDIRRIPRDAVWPCCGPAAGNALPAEQAAPDRDRSPVR